jgi:adenine-specific DNA methylase
LIHALRNVYKEVYLASNKVSKRDKLGIYAKIENATLDAFSLCIEAAYKTKPEKRLMLEKVRIQIETIKQLVRLANEMKIMEEKKYLFLAELLQEVSKMTNGWIRYLDTQNPPIQKRI